MIQTERLSIRPVSLGDADFIIELLNTKAYIENIGQRNIHTLTDAETYIEEKMLIHYRENGYGAFLITRKEDAVKLGILSLYNRPNVEGVDIGFAILPKYFAHGYATEAAAAVRDYAKYTLGLPEISAFTSKDNDASQHIIQKLGLVYEKEIVFGEEEEMLLYYRLVF